MTRTLALALAALLAACSRSGSDGGKERLKARTEAERAAHPAFDFSRPGEALVLSADDVARALGSFEWSAAIDWTVASEGAAEPAPSPAPPPPPAAEGQPAPFVPPPPPPPRVHALERHRIRQATTGEFRVEMDVDPGLGPGSDTGKEIVYAGGMTYARARFAPFRERPTDHGRDARRFREDSFHVGRALTALYGGALAIEPAGDATVLGRTARRYRLSLAPGAAAGTKPRVLPAGTPDPDSAARFKFLDGRVPESAEGELLLDAETGAPLRLRLAGAFTVKDAPGVRATVELLAQVTSLGDKVAAIEPPKSPLPDVRKPPGVAGALEAAGLKKKTEAEAGGSEPVDDEQ
ncbi:hypothetical protein [Anaeromyxobacter terrae]|uniref:hypothetical protein n=1 Tax=Anaeromyxobacter terrae TaxID=2925406 RepID=UPI001F5674C7|nr:hypothetical protein [Anaeromyxobacter sp. SG22]